ncbi:MAG: hypoxanthine phosphoribosyltransferase [Dehalococcoidales bacterium]|jgi:hypoxanthine phosphoribosyltransferase
MDSETKPQVLISAAAIDAAVKRMAAAITRDYQGKNPVLLGVLKGSFVFLADLARHLDFPLEIEFVRLASYGAGRESAGKVEVAQDLRLDIRGRHVLVVEDILDTGITLAFLMKYLQNKQPASLKLCALLDKPARRRVDVKIDYQGLEVPDKFLVGYGLDCDEKYRNLPDIRVLED